MNDAERKVIAVAILWNEVTEQRTTDKPLAGAVEELLGTGNPEEWQKKLDRYDKPRTVDVLEIEGVVREDWMENSDAQRDHLTDETPGGGGTYHAAYLMRKYRGKRIRITIEEVPTEEVPT